MVPTIIRIFANRLKTDRMIPIRLLLSSALAFLLTLQVVAQAHNHKHHEAHAATFEDPGHMTCAKEERTEALFEAHPELFSESLEAKAALEDFTRNFEETGDRSTTLVIPVVFHVVHIFGNENISNEQVHSAMEVLNEDFNAQTPDIASAVSEFQSVIGDVNVEFRLARKDPQGNCTSGIVRTVSNATLNGGTSLTQVSTIWPRNRYLNIYVCANINGAAGFTFIPSSVNGSQGAGIDAIYITHPYVGRIGTGNASRSHALSHEVGHWLNLEHTWGVTNQPGIATNCNQDDFVSDTPNTIGWTSCNLSGNTCGSLDNVENFMDYSYCYKMFTAGQATRMRAALMSSIAQRNNLHANSNLTFTGVNLPDAVCSADFAITSDPSICPGETVTFEDLSFNGITNWSWSFPGGSPSTSSASNPEITYNSPGLYDVTLTVSNAQGSESVTKTQSIQVVDEAELVVPFSENFEGFNGLHLENGWFVSNPDGDMTREWELYENAGYSGNKSMYVMGRFNAAGASEFIDSPNFDLSDLSQNAVLTFKYAHARRSNLSDDQLRVWISRNCGVNWSLRRTINMEDLPTVSGNVSGNFVPSGQSDWAEVEINNIVSVFLTDEFRIRFEYTSNRGNNLFIDDINLIDGLTLSTEDPDMTSDMALYPNPSSGVTTFEYQVNQPGKVTIELIDLTGKVVNVWMAADRAPGQYRDQYDVGALAPGVYFVRMQSSDGAGVKKLIVR